MKKVAAMCMMLVTMQMLSMFTAGGSGDTPGDRDAAVDMSMLGAAGKEEDTGHSLDLGDLTLNISHRSFNGFDSLSSVASTLQVDRRGFVQAPQYAERNLDKQTAEELDNRIQSLQKQREKIEKIGHKAVAGSDPAHYATLLSMYDEATMKIKEELVARSTKK